MPNIGYVDISIGHCTIKCAGREELFLPKGRKRYILRTKTAPKRFEAVHKG